MGWDACILTDMPREEGVFMFRQEDIDHCGDGCSEMTDTICIISLTYRLIIDQESSLTEAVLQDLITDSIMEMEDYKAILTDAIIIWEAVRVLIIGTETLVHLTEVAP